PVRASARGGTRGAGDRRDPDGRRPHARRPSGDDPDGPRPRLGVGWDGRDRSGERHARSTADRRDAEGGRWVLSSAAPAPSTRSDEQGYEPAAQRPPAGGDPRDRTVHGARREADVRSYRGSPATRRHGAVRARRRARGDARRAARPWVRDPRPAAARPAARALVPRRATRLPAGGP